MNIQFMTKANAITVKDGWTGENKTAYVPNFDELVKNASCEEEVQAIRETEVRMTSGKSIFKGFAFPIVYMAYADTLVFDRETRKQRWEKKWQMMQHPWYETVYGVKDSKEAMIAVIEAENR